MKTWNHLSPYGTFDHPDGKQTITRIDAERCVKSTKTLLFWLRLRKIPVYIGHPDDPRFQMQPEHMNPHVYGYVRDTFANEHGLWVHIVWTPSGEELIDNGVYTHLSPRWQMQKRSDGSYHPIKLISVGLTQNPNLPVDPLQKDKQPTPLSYLQKRTEKLAILQFTQKVQQRMEATGESYLEAWQTIYKENNPIF